ncbi:hypothetical protein B0I35DRAFT_507328 [Stachybotrys elegans]|uniref:Uncharacterized protein n=1 Tax=Stachybotrys elegans TaxID=80388 RepID=A0A8K0WYJ0_9HYPO|nr:hypothetical protein B0I35DRAFT_507328 [Stachybotrys elegans]
MDTPSADQQPPVRFRAGKKRKAYRQRTDDTDPESPPGEKPAPEPTPEERREAEVPADAPTADSNDDDESTVAAALRLRNARRSRLRGVGFRSDARPDERDADSLALTLASAASGDPTAAAVGIPGRFTHQTGLVGALNDKHMNEYIESRLSKRKEPEGPPSPDTQHLSAEPPLAPVPAGAPRRDNAATHGKLMEVEVPAGAAVEPRRRDESRKKPRLRKDGKPWRPRNRRGSDDIKRDQLVEAFLHENRLDVYDVPNASKVDDTAIEEDGAADERLAEQFKKQYLDELAQRRQRKKPAQPARPTNEDVLKGPKLGGSRNTRAAMRDLLLKKEKESKK